jgi:tagatose-6-phosphate ketose/aldose isomerase
MELAGATYTAKEIYQQPEIWRKSLDLFKKDKDEYKKFIKDVCSKHEMVKVIFSGAGTSAFIGDILVPVFRQQAEDKVYFESVATTEIVSNPKEYLVEDVPTVLVSFARSGNSPESVATVNLGKKLVKDFYQVVFTCNSEGQLTKNVACDEKSITILLPEESNDKSLAMTSSFSCMLLMGYALFQEDNSFVDQMDMVIANGKKVIDSVETCVDEILDVDFSRVIYLGSGLLGQLGHEASLKMLELSAGKVVSTFESSLGFRHGPKSIVNDESLITVFISHDPYTRKYDLDILKEVSEGTNAVKIIALTDKKDEVISKYADYQIVVNEAEDAIAHDFYLSLLYVVFAQILAMKKSIQLGISPDNPSPGGAISRVVQGVKIYDYE